MKKTQLIPLFAFLVICLAGVFFLDRHTEKQVMEESAAQLEAKMQSLEMVLDDELAEVSGDIRFLASTPPILGIARATKNEGIDPYDGTQLNRWNARLETIFVAFIENHPDIDQIRYIGLADNGRELVRVDRKHGSIRVVPSTGLQKKGGEGYFRMFSQANPDQVVFSPINLNREFGQIEFPFRPTFRVGMPVFDEPDNPFGFVILNMRAETLLDALRLEAENAELYIYDNNGQFIVHPNKAAEFGIELEKGISYNSVFDETRSDNPGDPLGQIINQNTGEALYNLHHKYRLSSLDEGLFLNIVMGYPESLLNKLMGDRRNTAIALLLGIAVLALLVVLALHHHMEKTLSLNETRSTFEAIVNSSSEAIIGMSPDGVVTSWNQAAQDMFGYTKTAAEGKSVQNLIHANGTDQLEEQLLQKVLLGEQSNHFEMTATGLTGKPMNLEITLSPIRTKKEVSGVAAVVRDVTQKKQTEEALKLLNQSLESQVKQRTAELEIAHENALAASKAKSAFVANISHEIRTPLNGLLGMLQILKNSPLTEEQERYLQLAENSSHSLRVLINDVLDLTKIESGRLEIEHIPFDLSRLVADLTASMSPAAQEKGLNMVLDMADITSQTTLGDPVRIKQVLANLIGNAIKFTETGHIMIQAGTRPDNQGNLLFSCTIRDSGIGISQEKIDHIFTEFTQEDSTTTRQFGGTGLGLAICKRLIDLMDGTIEVKSTKDKGTEFHIVVPLQSLPSQKENRFMSLEDKSILLAIPHFETRSALAKQLETWGANVRGFEHEDALTTFLAAEAAKPFEMLIIDGRFGTGELEALVQKTTQTPTKLKVVRLLDTMDQPKPREDDMNRLFLNKPVNPFDLCTCLKKAFASNPNGNTAVGEEQKTKADPESPGTPSGQTVLVVDDNRVNRMVLRGLLKPYKYNVITAENGRQALQLLGELEPAKVPILILIDCNMPVMDGYETTRRIREGEAGPNLQNIPIIAVTANALSGEQEHCIQVGMNDYLPKPIDSDALKRKLVHWVNLDLNPNSRPRNNPEPSKHRV